MDLFVQYLYIEESMHIIYAESTDIECMCIMSLQTDEGQLEFMSNMAKTRIPAPIYGK